MTANTTSPLVLTTLSGNQVSVVEHYFNGNGALTLMVTSPAFGIITVAEIEPGVFKNIGGKGGIKIAPATAAELRAAAQAEADEARLKLEEEEEEEARLGVLLQWGSGRSYGRTTINGTEISEQFLEAQLNARGLAIDTDWDRYFTRIARVPQAVCAEIVAAALAQPKPEPKRPALTVQLWEPCESCGAEPCYATARGHLCERCAGA